MSIGLKKNILQSKQLRNLDFDAVWELVRAMGSSSFPKKETISIKFLAGREGGLVGR